MIYGSVCAGIEAATAAWEPLGWSAAWFSEIEPFPCALLQHHYPGTPNLGDMTKLQERQEFNDTAIDILIGGTPCQSFSVAGLRKGMADPRGNLTLTFLSIVEKKKPRWVVYENVPGIISEKTEALKSLLDGLEELGYIIDIDILDAQFFGVPQRRRRVFICAQSITDLLKQKTDTSAITIAQCWQEILHGILISQYQEYAREPGSSDLAYLSRDGVQKRMNLFGFIGEKKSYEKLREHLVEAYQRHQAEQKSSAMHLGESGKELTPGDPLMDLKGVDQYILTEQSLKAFLDESYQVMKSFITSMGTSTITAEQIYMCSQAVLCIARLILLLNPLSPSFWSGVSSSLIALKEYTNYARQANNDLFAGMEWVQKRCDFLRQAERAIISFSGLRTRNFAREIFPISNSLSGDTPPSRKAGKNIAACLGGCTPGSRQRGDKSEPQLNARAGTGGGNLPLIMAHGQGNAEIRENGSPSLTCNHEAPILAFNSPQTVRRLTPLECERLQGFPDGYTMIPFRAKPSSDSHRYKALGNSMAVPVIRWIGERIQAVEDIL